MGRIKNTDKYPIKENPSAKDYIIGSDSENGGKTVNFPVVPFFNVYSTKEKMVGHWDLTDKPIYRIMIPFNFTGTDYYTVTHNLDIDTYIRVDHYDGFGAIRSVLEMLMINELYGSPNGVGVFGSANELNFGGDTVNLNHIDGYLILEYTKN